MEDRLAAVHRRPDGSGIADVDGDGLPIHARDRRRVEDDHLVAAADELVTDVAAEETAPTRDHHSHRRLLEGPTADATREGRRRISSAPTIAEW